MKPDRPYKVIFCGTPHFALPSLKALAEAEAFEVVMVVTQPDRPAGRGHKLQPSPVKQWALENNLPVISPESVNQPEVIAQLRELRSDACVVVAFGQILKKDFLNLYPQKCVNVHGSLLPRWRGAAPIQRSLMAGDLESGVCLQVVVSKLDAGAVIGERRLHLSVDMQASTLHDQLSLLGADLLIKEFTQFLGGEITPQTQDESLVTYAAKITKEDSLIQWHKSAKSIHDAVRGLALGPQAFTTLQGRNVKILKTRISERSGEPGSVTHIEKTFFSVACGDGSLDILELQPESKKRLSAEEFLRGFPLQRGDRFGS